VEPGLLLLQLAVTVVIVIVLIDPLPSHGAAGSRSLIYEESHL